MTRGRFITLEGGEGAGKSTQARLLADRLAAEGIAVLLTREPGGTTGAEAIRALLLDPAGEGWGMRAEALLFAAARADHVERRIRPALEAGQWVICDRFVDSNRAYQGGGGGLADEALMALHRFGSGGLLPDLTLLMELDATRAEARIAARDGADGDRIERRGADYHAAVAARFAELAGTEPARFFRVDGAEDKRLVHERIWRAVAPLIGAAP